jgi:hypothetical protein
MLKLEKVQLESDMQNLQSYILFIMKQGVDVCHVNVNITGWLHLSGRTVALMVFFSFVTIDVTKT